MSPKQKAVKPLKHGWEKAALVVAVGLAVASGATRIHAEPPSDGDAPPTNGAPRNGGPRGERGQRPSPEQMKAMHGKMLRGALTKAGFTETTLQDTIVAFSETQESARRGLRDQVRKLRESLMDSATTDAQLSTRLQALQSAAAAEKTRSASAESALETKISFKSKPRLNALLTSMGLVGEAAAYAPPPPGPRGPGGMGGPGGHGGPGGGHGGPGGPPRPDGDSDGPPPPPNDDMPPSDS